jgi:hypothetical protein
LYHALAFRFFLHQTWTGPALPPVLTNLRYI